MSSRLIIKKRLKTVSIYLVVLYLMGSDHILQIRRATTFR
jgi:hypothetical protein